MYKWENKGERNDNVKKAIKNERILTRGEQQ